MSLSSCKHALLEPWPPDAARTEQDIWGFYKYCKGAVDVLYADFIMCPYPNDIYDGSGDSWGMLACGTDEAEHSLATAAVQKFTNGAWSPSNSPLVKFGGPWFRRSDRIPWVNSYLGIRLANIALAHLDGSDLIDDLDDPTRRYDLTWFKGQAYFWRAYLEFDLLRRYGPFIISTKVEELDETTYRGRNTLEECVAQIVRDCDAAIDSLPLLWDEDNWFRVNKTCAQALKSRTLLYYASPLYQGDFKSFGLDKGEVGDVQRWKDAIEATRAAINDNDFYQLVKVTNFKRPYSEAGTYNYVVHMAANLENNELIFSTSKTTNLSYNYERFNLPAGIDGCEGYTNPTQELVDKFEFVTGSGSNRKAEMIPLEEFVKNNPGKNPFDNRDPRFYNDILYNGTFWGTSSSKGYYIDMWEPATIDGVAYPGGKHRDKTLKQSTKTGYYYRKFLTENFYAYATNQYTSLSRTRHEIRFSELILNYAEAMNEAYGPEVQHPDGPLRDFGAGSVCTAKDAVDAIRARVNMPPVPSGLTQDEMREVIHHERDIELCFEGHRFYDVRRWKEGPEKFGTPIHGVVITPTKIDKKTGRPTEYEYKVEEVEKRVWKDCYYWWPVPMAEIVKYPNNGLEQNPEW